MASLLRGARRAAGLTQRALAEVTHEHQPAIAAIESGQRGVTYEHLVRLLAPTGHKLQVFKTTSSSAHEVANKVYERLRANRESDAFREIIQLSDDLNAASRVDLVCLTATKPPSTGDSRYDALIAGICDLYISRSRVPRADWITQTRALPVEWFVDDVPEFHGNARRTTPKELAKRNVFLAASELESV